MHNKRDQALQRARRRRGKPPLTEYKTISIKVPVTQLRSGTNHEAIEETHRKLHKVRGHYAVYTDDRKLFGKHTGRFWIPAHERGTDQEGAIVKSYQVGPQ